MNEIIKKYKNGEKHPRKIRGQGLVEFALSLPILLLVFMGIFEFGRLMFIYIVVSTSSREAARYGVAVGDVDVVDSGSKRYYDCTGIQNAALALGSVINMTAADISISYDNGPGTSTTYATCADLASSTSDISLGDRIVVTVNYTYTPIAQYAGFSAVPSFVITSTSNRTILKSIPLTGYGGSVSGSTSTPSPTASSPLSPLLNSFADDNSDPINCANVSIVIDPKNAWSTGNPGTNPDQYVLRIGIGGSDSYQAFSNPFTWNTGVTINDTDTSVFIVKGFWSSGSTYSDELTISLTCTSGVLSQ